MDDIRAAGVDILTLGQYLRPTPNHLPIERWVTPEEFERYREWALQKGFLECVSGPLVRSSYRAERRCERNNAGSASRRRHRPHRPLACAGWVASTTNRRGARCRRSPTRATRTTRDEIWFLEHPPVFTLGMNAKPEHVLAPGDIPVVQIDRGGQVTYHGPGQLVVYPLLDVRRLGIGVRQLVVALENASSRWLRSGTSRRRTSRCAGHLRRRVANSPASGYGYAAAAAIMVSRSMWQWIWSRSERINPCGYAGSRSHRSAHAWASRSRELRSLRATARATLAAVRSAAAARMRRRGSEPTRSCSPANIEENQSCVQSFCAVTVHHPQLGVEEIARAAAEAGSRAPARACSRLRLSGCADGRRQVSGQAGGAVHSRQRSCRCRHSKWRPTSRT